MKNLPSQFILLYLAVFVNIVAFSMIFPLLPFYGRTFSSNDLVIGLLVASFAAAQFLFAPLWGSLSDRFGRKSILAGGLIGIAGSFFLFAAATNLTILFITRFLQGMFAAAILPSARAYVADLTTGEERIKALGHLGASLSLGIILGPAIGSILAQVHITLPFLAGGTVALLNFIFVFYLLPESLSERVMVSLRSQRGFLLKNTHRVWRGLRENLAPLFLISLVWSLAMATNMIAVPLLAIDKFQLNPNHIGILFSFMGAVSAFMQIVLLTAITSRIGKRMTITGGLLFMALGLLATPLLPPVIAFLYGAGAAIAMGSAVSRPSLTALISEETTEPQGITMGTATAFESLGRLIGPLLGGFLFAFGSHLPFLAAGGIIILTLAVLIRFTTFLQPTKAQSS